MWRLWSPKLRLAKSWVAAGITGPRVGEVVLWVAVLVYGCFFFLRYFLKWENLYLNSNFWDLTEEVYINGRHTVDAQPTSVFFSIDLWFFHEKLLLAGLIQVCFALNLHFCFKAKTFISLSDLTTGQKQSRQRAPASRPPVHMLMSYTRTSCGCGVKRSDFKQLKPTVPECRVGSAWYMSSISHKLDCLHSHWAGVTWKALCREWILVGVILSAPLLDFHIVSVLWEGASYDRTFKEKESGKCQLLPNLWSQESHDILWSTSCWSKSLQWLPPGKGILHWETGLSHTVGWGTDGDPFWHLLPPSECSNVCCLDVHVGGWLVSRPLAFACLASFW